ncbi:WD40 repeat-like protein [Ceratobasidium sp. AG-I]|nr:WD40 repeat-like protein [Ceratobasidium sp. AG-I]
MSATPPTKLSQVTVQPDVLSVINDVEQGVIEHEDVWVSCYESDRPSVHGKVQVTISDEARDQSVFKGRDGVTCQKVEEGAFYISCPALNIRNRVVRFPSHTIKLPPLPATKTTSKLDYGINSLDVSKDGQTWVAGLGNGSIVLGSSPGARSRNEPMVLPIHKSTVSSVKFVYDSIDGEVAPTRVLTASEDFTLFLTDIPAPSSAPSTSQPQHKRLAAHTRALTASSILPNSLAVSAALDGTLRIWSIHPSSSAAQLGMVRSTGDVSILSLSTASSGSLTLAALGLQSGHFDLVDIDTKSTVFTSANEGFAYTRHGALDAISLHSLQEGEWLLATGSRSGWLAVYTCTTKDGSFTVTSLGNSVRNGAGIADLEFVPSSTENKYPDILVATTDGLPYQLRLAQPPSSSSPTPELEVAAEFAGGPDCSLVRAIVGNAETRTAWLAGDDGVIWVYKF